jgi:hypothetical protein
LTTAIGFALKSSNVTSFFFLTLRKTTCIFEITTAGACDEGDDQSTTPTYFPLLKKQFYFPNTIFQIFVQ